MNRKPIRLHDLQEIARQLPTDNSLTIFGKAENAGTGFIVSMTIEYLGADYTFEVGDKGWEFVGEVDLSY